MSCTSKQTYLQKEPLLQSDIEKPVIPFALDEAYLVLRTDSDGVIKPSYRFKECKKRILICVKWEMKTVWFNDLSWFMINGWGLTKRKSLIK